MRKFWNWKKENEARTLYLDGAISDETWWGDEVTPKMFERELKDGSGDITVWINSPGGDVFAGAEIYNMLKEYTGKITVKINGICASIASVIAMAGDTVLMSPVSTIMIHNPETIAIGDESEMMKARDMLVEIKDAIINAYELKTGLSRVKIGHLMDSESWMNAGTAIDLGFADGMMYSAAEKPDETNVSNQIYSRQSVTNSLIQKLQYSKLKNKHAEGTAGEKKTGKPVDLFFKRLNLLK